MQGVGESLLTGNPKPKGMAIPWFTRKANMNLPISEDYKKIDGFDSYYITQSGRVYQYRENAPYSGFRELAQKGRNNSRRYMHVALQHDNKTTYYQIHTLVAKHFVDGYFEGAVVNHIDGNIHNNDVSNLEWITQKENIHKQYETSGVGATRNYYKYRLVDPSGCSLGEFVGANAAIRYIKESGLPASPSGLRRNYKSKGYKLVRL